MPARKPETKPCCSPKTGSCCPANTVFQDRPSLTLDEAGDLAAVFKILANDTRLRLLFALAKAGEMCVSDLAEALTMKPQAVCNQLQRLVDLGSLTSKRQGNNVYYRIIDPCITSLLDRGLCLMEAARDRRGWSQVSGGPAASVS